MCVWLSTKRKETAVWRGRGRQSEREWEREREERDNEKEMLCGSLTDMRLGMSATVRNAAEGKEKRTDQW